MLPYQMQDHFADGVCFVPLAPIRDHNRMTSTIAHELGIQEVGTQPLLETVKASLRDKQLLLLLDNFEQIITAAPLLGDLLGACHQLVILVMSREVLHLQAENLFPVPPLVLPDLTDLPESKELELYAEVEVLRLVAQGMTDAQVVEQLVISPRTVNWHLTTIYSKLQVTSRCAATHYALQYHLV